MGKTETATGGLDDWVPADFPHTRGSRSRSIERRPAAAAAKPSDARRPVKTGATTNGSAAAVREWVKDAADPERKRLEDARAQAEERTRAAEARALRAEREVERLRRQLAARPPGQRKPAPAAKAGSAAESSPVAKSSAAAKRAQNVTDEADAPAAFDLNAASFEALRALGLSITQSARLISQREQMGGFRSIDDLDRLYGLPRETRDLLRETCRV